MGGVRMKQTRRQPAIIISKDGQLQPLLCMAEVCKLLHVSRPTIYDLIDEGLPVIGFGRAVRFSQSSLKDWLKGREEIAKKVKCHMARRTYSGGNTRPSLIIL